MNQKEKEMEDALIAEAVAKGRVKKCPDGMAHAALQYNAAFMRDKFGDLVEDVTEYTPMLLGPTGIGGLAKNFRPSNVEKRRRVWARRG